MEKKYINDRELLYEVILSKGKGIPTEKLKSLLILLAKNVTIKRSNEINIIYRGDMLNDCILQLLLQWNKFDEKKYDNSIPYFTELIKRSMVATYRVLNNIKPLQMINTRFISLSKLNVI